MLVSAVCVCEAAIKSALGKLRVPDDLPSSGSLTICLRDSMSSRSRACRSAQPMRGLCDLPPIHNDPFDRLLVAQALCERATTVSADPVFEGYAVARIW